MRIYTLLLESTIQGVVTGVIYAGPSLVQAFELAKSLYGWEPSNFVFESWVNGHGEEIRTEGFARLNDAGKYEWLEHIEEPEDGGGPFTYHGDGATFRWHRQDERCETCISIAYSRRALDSIVQQGKR